MKPWDPPDEHLYPVLDGLLEDWRASVRLPFEGIRVAGTLWSPRSHEIKDFLARHQIAYQWLDIDRDEAARTSATAQAGDRLRLPVVYFRWHDEVEPDVQDMATKVGLSHRALPSYDPGSWRRAGDSRLRSNLGGPAAPD
jgi:thioredoxin reductase (NADPH)